MTLFAKPVRFEKMQAGQNDFLFFPASVLTGFATLEDLGNSVRALCHRQRGVGADGVVFYTLKTHKLLIVNADGSLAETCGNALRCFGVLLLQKNRWDGRTRLSLFPHFNKTGKNGPFATLLAGQQTPYASRGWVSVAMGRETEVREIVLSEKQRRQLPHMRPEDSLRSFFVSLANPHWVFISSAFAGFSQSMRAEFGQIAQNKLTDDPPANIGLLTKQDTNDGDILQPWPLVVFERGVGLTQCCGSGAVAARAALEHAHLVEAKTPCVDFIMPGGALRISQEHVGKQSERVLTGDAECVFRGVVG